MFVRCRRVAGLHRFRIALLGALLLAGLLPVPVQGADITLIAATGGTKISADTNAIDGTGAWTTLTGPSISGVNGALDNGNYEFYVIATDGFEFNRAAQVSVAFAGNCGNLSAGTTAGFPLQHSLFLYLTGKTTGGCTFTLSGLQVRPTKSGSAPLEAAVIHVNGLVARAGAACCEIGKLAVVPGAAVLKFVQTPTTGNPVVAGITPQPIVRSEDKYGNPRSGDKITLDLRTGTGTPGANLNCALEDERTDAAGNAVFLACDINKPGIGYRLIALFQPNPSARIVSVISDPFNVFGSGSKLGFTKQPTGGIVGQPWPIQPVVAVQDALGLTVTSGQDSTPAVTLFLGPGAPAGATLSCSGGTTVTAVAGVATFSGCSGSAAGIYSLGASTAKLPNGATPSPAVGTEFTVSGLTAVTLTTSAPTPPGAKDSVILWGQGFTLAVQFAMPNGSGRKFTLEASLDGATWTSIANLTTDGEGRASFRYTPVTNLFYRAGFAGAADLLANTSNQVRTVVRELAVLRPTNSGTVKALALGASIPFTTTVRPARPELAPARVSFFIYHLESGAWKLKTKRDVVVNAAGLATTTVVFSLVGDWRVRSQANPTAYNANSVMTPIEQYRVR